MRGSWFRTMMHCSSYVKDTHYRRLWTLSLVPALLTTTLMSRKQAQALLMAEANNDRIVCEPFCYAATTKQSISTLGVRRRGASLTVYGVVTNDRRQHITALLPHNNAHHAGSWCWNIRNVPRCLNGFKELPTPHASDILNPIFLLLGKRMVSPGTLLAKLARVPRLERSIAEAKIVIVRRTVCRRVDFTIAIDELGKRVVFGIQGAIHGVVCCDKFRVLPKSYRSCWNA